MNLSGVSVRELLSKYELELSDLLVLWDEVQLPWGTIRIHPDGSAGSHNGAKSVISALGTQGFARLRLGCGPEPPVSRRKECVVKQRKKAEFEVYVQIGTTKGKLSVECDRRRGVQDVLINYLTMRLDEDLRRQKKLREKREQRPARRPRRPPPAPPAAPEQTAAAS